MRRVQLREMERADRQRGLTRGDQVHRAARDRPRVVERSPDGKERGLHLDHKRVEGMQRRGTRTHQLRQPRSRVLERLLMAVGKYTVGQGHGSVQLSNKSLRRTAADRRLLASASLRRIDGLKKVCGVQERAPLGPRQG